MSTCNSCRGKSRTTRQTGLATSQWGQRVSWAGGAGAGDTAPWPRHTTPTVHTRVLRPKDLDTDLNTPPNVTPRVLVISPGRVGSSLTKAVLKGQTGTCGHWPQVLFTQPEAPRSRAHQQHMKNRESRRCHIWPRPFDVACTPPTVRERPLGPAGGPGPGSAGSQLWALSGDLAV